MHGWKTFENKRGGTSYGTRWDEIPAVAISKSGVTLNKPAWRLLDGTGVTRCQLKYRGPYLGIKFHNGTAPVKDQYVLNKMGDDDTDLRHVSCGKVAKKYPKCVKQAYRVELDEDDYLMLVAKLTPDNTL